MLKSDDRRSPLRTARARAGVRLLEPVPLRPSRSAEWADLVAQAAECFTRDAKNQRYGSPPQTGPHPAVVNSAVFHSAIRHPAVLHPVDLQSARLQLVGRQCLAGAGAGPASESRARLSAGWLEQCRARLAHSGCIELLPTSARDRALISAIRRRPVLVAAVAGDRPNAVRRPGANVSGQTVIAVLHGLAGPGEGPFGFLEETRSGLGVRHFALTTPSAEADRILEAWRELEADGPTAVSVHMFRPGRPATRSELALVSGVARLSRDGVEWERSVPEDEWAALFEAAIPL